MSVVAVAGTTLLPCVCHEVSGSSPYAPVQQPLSHQEISQKLLFHCNADRSVILMRLAAANQDNTHDLFNWTMALQPVSLTGLYRFR